MRWSFPIGHLFGSELRVHGTFFLLVAWIAAVGYFDGGLPEAVINTVYILILFACVIAHEFGHALTARRFGIHTPTVTLLPIGGVAALERMPEKPGQEILVALAGPMVNVVIFLVLALGLGFHTLSNTGLETLTWAALPAQIAWLNAILAGFNLLPAFPMDGGRVLRAALASVMSRAQATRVAASAGQVLAFGMGLYGLMAGNVILVLIAFFIFISAGAESSQEAVRRLSEKFSARDAMITEFETLHPDDTLDTAAATLIRTTQHEFPVVDPASGGALGLLTRTALYTALEQQPRSTAVERVMDRGLPTLRLDAPLKSVLDAMQAGASTVLVTARSGALVGYVTRENLGELMVVSAARTQSA